MNLIEETQWSIERAKEAARTVFAAPMAEKISESLDRCLEAYREKQGKPEQLVLPAVPERDRQSMYNFIHDCFAEWVADPTVGLSGMNDGEFALAKAIIDALDTHNPEGSETP